MNCHDLEARLHAYVDRELSVADTAAADAHITGCGPCAAAIRREYHFRQLLVLQPRERAPAELRAGIEARCRRQDRTRRHLQWLAVPALAVAAAVMTAFFSPGRASAPLVEQLVSKHVAFSQLERPAELTTSDPREVAMWFQERADLRIVVPDTATVLLDPDGTAARAYGVRATPTVLLIGRNFDVVARAMGSRPWSERTGRAFLGALLGQSGH